MSGSTVSLRYIFLGLWLALFLRAAFGDLFRYDFPMVYFPWTGYFVYGLIIGVPLLVILFKRIADLGVVRLTVYTGFLVILAFYLLDLLLERTHLGTGWLDGPNGFDWGEAISASVEGAGWVRLITYIGLGCVVARRKGLILGIVISMLIALVDSIIGWLVLLPGDGGFESAPLRLFLDYYWPEVIPAILRDVLIQVIVLTFFGLLGAMITRYRWPRSYRPRLVPSSKRRHRPARRITLDNRLDSIELAGF